MNNSEQRKHAATMDEQAELVRQLLIDAGYTPYEILTGGHRDMETISGFLVWRHADGTLRIRMRPGDDWWDLILDDDGGKHVHFTAEYAYLVELLAGYSQTLKANGCVMGKCNTRTLVVQEGSTHE